MSSSPLRHAPALVGAALLALFILGVGSSCVGMYGLEGYGSAVAELCTRIAECNTPSHYPACTEQASARLQAASSDERAAFLRMFSDAACLTTCSAASACLDSVPICTPSSAACATPAECCGFWRSDAACAEGSCCQPDGVACASDADCCGAPCLGPPGARTCGGGQCALTDESCVDEPCCGEIRCDAESQVCTQCLEYGAPCEVAGDCCSNYCVKTNGPELGDDKDSGALGTCGDPECGLADGVACQSADECCSDYCVPIAGDGHGVCNSSDCLQNGFRCNDGEACCSGVCDPMFGCVDIPGCIPLQAPCNDDDLCCLGICDSTDTGACCLADYTPCSSDFECCSATCAYDAALAMDVCQSRDRCAQENKVCVSGADCCSQRCDLSNQQCCKIVSNTCAHGVCVLGDPLDPMCSMVAQAGDPFGDAGCIAAICAAPGLEGCCCHDWSQKCIDAVSSHCGIACAVADN